MKRNFLEGKTGPEEKRPEGRLVQKKRGQKEGWFRRKEAKGRLVQKKRGQKEVWFRRKEARRKGGPEEKRPEGRVVQKKRGQKEADPEG